MDKQRILDAYIQFLDRKIKDTEKSANSLREGVDTAPGPMQSHSDTTKFQQSKIVSEVVQRLISLKRLRALVSMLPRKKSEYPATGALIVLQDMIFQEKEYYFVIPEMGGDSLEFKEGEVFFLSPQSPILEAVSKLKQGDSFELRGRKLRLVSIS